jgi:hypothetical protein
MPFSKSQVAAQKIKKAKEQAKKIDALGTGAEPIISRHAMREEPKPAKAPKSKAKGEPKAAKATK